jgi:transglutaminase-like putative cysteine protease
MKAARYHVAHETRYEYHQPVGLSRQVVRLAPRVVPWQACRAHSLQIQPDAEILSVRSDAFGNPVTSFAIEADHAALLVRAESWIDVAARPFPDDAATPPWEKVRARLAYHGGVRPLPADLDAARFLFESTRVRNKRELAAWALASFPPGVPLLVGVRALMNRIHREFTFDPRATDVSTPVMEVFTRRRGVCQDFAHLMLSCLRSIGLAARYVSGYLLTRPPPGRPRLIGADASHAWVSVYCPDQGWVDTDPTNAIFPGKEHVTLGWGRDYDDVIPLRGVLLGGGDHEISIEVTVTPAADYEALFEKPLPELPPPDAASN